MKLMIPTLAAVAIATGGYAVYDNTTPDVQKKQQVEQKQKADPTQKKQLTEEQQRAHEQKKAAKLAKMTDEQRKAYEQNMAAKKAQMTDEQKRALKQKQGLYDPQKKQMTDEQRKAYEQKLAGKRAQMTDEQRAAYEKKKAANPTVGKQKIFRLVTQQDVERAWQSAPVNAEMQISYREIAGAAGQYQWHIGDTAWWVRLHGATGQEMAQLDKSKTYRVTGVVLDQNFGVIEVWLKSLASN
ncbi:MAG: hypothetical protein WD716_13760 [Fimbriimonadaceae bacterium]